MALTRLQQDALAGSTITASNLANNSVTADKIANSAVTVGKIANSAVTAPKVDTTASQLFGMRNKIINGGLDVWQRATSFTDWTSFAYLVDRFRIGYDGTPANGRTLTQQAFALGQTDVPEGDPKFYMQYAFPSCGTPNNYIRTDIEGVRTLAGKVCTFSFWAKVPSGTMTIGVAVCQEFGSGGSPSAGVYPSQTNYTVTTTWQKFVYTTTMPSISGKTLGTDGNDKMWPAIWFPTNAAGTIHLANFQLEEGAVATPFEKRPYGLELALCQRYCQVRTDYGGVTNFYCYQAGSSGYYSRCEPLPVRMRATPTSTILGTVVGTISGTRHSPDSVHFEWSGLSGGYGYIYNTTTSGVEPLYKLEAEI